MKKLFLAGLFASVAILGDFRSARADTLAYLGTNAGDFGTLDLSTGAFSVQGNFGLTLAGLAWGNGSLYGVPYNGGGSLYTVNRSDGSLTLVGNSAVTYDDFGSTSAGLYGVSTSANLYSVDASTGAATLIGPIGVGLGGFRSLSNNGSALYFSDGTSLYTLDTTTGAATLVGSTGGPSLGAMTFIGGTFYAGQDSPDIRVDTLNPATGLATTGPLVTGTNGQFYALAPVPEPSTWVLLVVGTGCAGLLVRRRLGV